MIPALTLAATSFRKDQLLDPTIPQIALAGRSNVGKSSLVNALAGRKQLAKTSATPGKTRSINYYSLPINEGIAYLVDLPGYGYAKCSQSERNKWAELLEYYLSNTQGLLALALLIDARLSPQSLDLGLVTFARSIHLPIIPILTKIDKCRKKDLEQVVKEWGIHFVDADMVRTSAFKKNGLDTLWERLLNSFSTYSLASQDEESTS